MTRRIVPPTFLRAWMTDPINQRTIRMAVSRSLPSSITGADPGRWINRRWVKKIKPKFGPRLTSGGGRNKSKRRPPSHVDPPSQQILDVASLIFRNAEITSNLDIENMQFLLASCLLFAASVAGADASPRRRQQDGAVVHEVSLLLVPGRYVGVRMRRNDRVQRIPPARPDG